MLVFKAAMLNAFLLFVGVAIRRHADEPSHGSPGANQAMPSPFVYNTFHNHIAAAARVLGEAQHLTREMHGAELLELEASVDGHLRIAQRALEGDIAASDEVEPTVPVPGSLMEEMEKMEEEAMPSEPTNQDLEAANSAQTWAKFIGLKDPWWFGMTKNPAWELYGLVQNIRLSEEDGRNSYDDGHHHRLLHVLALYFWNTAHQSFSSSSSMLQTLGADYRMVMGLNTNGTSGADAKFKEAIARLGNSLPNFFTGDTARKDRHKQLFAQIFTCSYGSGHKSAAKAVEQYLKAKTWLAESVDTTRDQEFFSILVKATDFGFNEYVLRRQWYKLYNKFDKFNQALGVCAPPCPAPKCDNGRKEQFRASILRRAPDLIVTVYHMDLLPLMELSRDLGNIPLLHVATDIDLKMHEVFPVAPVYPRFRLAVPFNLDEAWNTIAPVPPEQGFVSGYPVRAEFLEPVHKATVTEMRNERFPKDAMIILVMSGGGGQSVPFPYILANNGLDGHKAHIVVIAGGDNKAQVNMAAKLKRKVQFPPANADTMVQRIAARKGYEREFYQGRKDEITVEIVKDPNNPKKAELEFYVTGKEIALLMDIADVVITKPGGGSTAELAYRGPPAVFDGTNGFLHWEEYNVQVFEDHSRGTRLMKANSKDLNEAIWKAFRWGRSTVIAEDPNPVIIDNPARYAEGVEKLMQTSCDRCETLDSKKVSGDSPMNQHPRAKAPERHMPQKISI